MKWASNIQGSVGRVNSVVDYRIAPLSPVVGLWQSERTSPIAVSGVSLVKLRPVRILSAF